MAENIMTYKERDFGIDIKKPLKAYEGAEKYIFISYAHRDAEKVFPIMKTLQDNDFRIWFDGGIELGNEWDDEIAEHIQDAAIMLAFISGNYVASENCKDELKFARDENIERILIYLEDAKLPPGIKMRLGRQQAIHYFRYENKSEFYEKLFNAAELKELRKDFVINEEFASANNKPVQNLPLDIVSNEPEVAEIEKAEISCTDKGRTSRITKRLKMNAQTYGIELNDELDGFVKWLIDSEMLDDNSVHKYARALLTLSAILKEMKICDKPLYEIKDENQLLHILDKIKTHSELRHKDERMHGLYSASLKKFYKLSIEGKNVEFSQSDEEKNTGDYGEETEAVKVEKIEISCIDDGGTTRITKRLKMNAQTYGIELKGELDGFVKWLIAPGVLDDNSVHKYARALLTLSAMLMEMKMCDKPLYEIKDENQLLQILNKIKTHVKLRNKDEGMNGIYSTALREFCKFAKTISETI